MASVFGLMIATAATFIIAIFVVHTRTCPAVESALGIVRNSAEARAALGEPIRAGWLVKGAVRDNLRVGFALLAIPVQGSRAKGTLNVVANRVGAQWDMEGVVLRTEGQRLDLTPAPEKEASLYPAEGLVYLLPLDDDAAVLMGDYPSYFKARLDLDVKILPVLPLGNAADVANSKTNQVSAEKAVDYMVRENPSIYADLDSVLIGVTSRDMTIESYGWSFATNYRHEGRFGIISTKHLKDMPWLAGENPEVLPIRVRKMVLKNVAILHYQLELSEDATSALAGAVFSGRDADEMGENFLGEGGAWDSWHSGAPCVTVTQGPGGRQSWRIACNDQAPNDSRYELFENYTDIPLFVEARTDMPFGRAYPLPFTRVYRPQDPAVRGFGVGGSHSLNIFLYSEQPEFSDMVLYLADGGKVPFYGGGATQAGTTSKNQNSLEGTVLWSAAEQGRFSLAKLKWTGSSWTLNALDGWTYLFNWRAWQNAHNGNLAGIDVAPGKSFRFKWSGVRAANTLRLESPEGDWLEIEHGPTEQIREARDSTGRVVDYEYDAGRRLVHVMDAVNGDERYEYDSKDQMTAVRDAYGRTLLANTYDENGDIREQVLADGRKLAYEYRRDGDGKIEWMKFTDPRGYEVEWTRGRRGYIRTLPELPRR